MCRRSPTTISVVMGNKGVKDDENSKKLHRWYRHDDKTEVKMYELKQYSISWMHSQRMGKLRVVPKEKKVIWWIFNDNCFLWVK